jgi:squalene-hopene/tetraprenyl-beta-curcumene cyclase
LQRGADWLAQSQNDDGGWGGRSGTPSSIEETALALDGLVAMLEQEHNPRWKESAQRAAEYLAHTTDGGTWFPPSPIGFYFANLWYYEKLYPVIFVVAALTRFDNLE